MKNESDQLYNEFASGFSSRAEYESFKTYIEFNTDFKEVKAIGKYARMGFSEIWFEHLPTGEIYSLAAPDAPFGGVWERVDSRAEYITHISN